MEHYLAESIFFLFFGAKSIFDFTAAFLMCIVSMGSKIASIRFYVKIPGFTLRKTFCAKYLEKNACRMYNILK